MDEIRFHAELGNDHTIRVPEGTVITPGSVEVTVRSCPQPTHAGTADDLPKREDFASVWEWLHAVGRAAENWDVDLPSDLAANHDFYTHGKASE